MPAYVVFTDRTLIEMAEKRPSTLDEMARIGGVGAAKLERYGAAFLEVISGEAAEEVHPVRRKLAGQEAGDVYRPPASLRRPNWPAVTTAPTSR